MAFHDLIDAEELLAHLADSRWVVVDCRFDLAAPAAGEQRYHQGHIPGAHFAHLDRDLSGSPGPRDGRHPLPTAEAFAATLQGWGVRPDSQIIAYDDAGGAFAARLWWLCRWLGHDAVAVLDGGLPAWLEIGQDLSTQVPAPTPGRVAPAPRHALVATAAELLQPGVDDGIVVIDARNAARFRGEAEPIDPVAGHVPGALNRPHVDNLDDTGRFRDPEQLRDDFTGLLDGRSPHDVVAMCGSGVTACHNLLAMHRAGLNEGRLYPGSWSEWIRDPARPTEPPRRGT